MAWSMLGNLPFRARLKQAPVEKRILNHIQNKIKIGRTKSRHLKGDRDADVKRRQQTLRDTFYGKSVLLKKVNKIEEFPPQEQVEICFAGRSNVGKSSLINSLLNAQPGRDAKVSPKPGETTSIDFYRVHQIAKSAAERQLLSQQQLGQQQQQSSSSSAAARQSSVKRRSKGRFSRSSSSSPPPKPAGQSKLDAESREEKGHTTPTATTPLEDLVVTASEECPIFVDLPGYGFAHAKPEDQARWTALTEHFFTQRNGALGTVVLVIDARHGLKAADRDFVSSLQVHVLS